MKCWKCDALMDEPSNGKLSFRETCDKCHAWLHCCKNCQHYQPGKPNDCAIPGTELIKDRESMNFCEDYKLLGAGPAKAVDPKDVLKRLFGDD